MAKSKRHVVLRLTMAVLSVILSLTLAEAFVRAVDGFELFSVRLQPVMTMHIGKVSIDTRFLRPVPRAAGIEYALFQETPRLIGLDVPVDEDVEAMDAAFPGDAHYAFTAWNREFLKSRICSGSNFFSASVREVFELRSPDGSVYPRFRLLPAVKTSQGMMINGFGMRGPELSVSKPPGVIRIGFIGASTTLGNIYEPYSYPDYLIHWLNLWSAQQGLGVRFEGMNTGVYGANAGDYPNVARFQLLPYAPDVVIFYEGHNDFTVPFTSCQRGQATGMNRNSQALQQFRPFPQVAFYSAVAQRVFSVLAEGTTEPAKPTCAVQWPDGLDRRAADITSPALAPGHQELVRMLTSLREILSSADVPLVVASFPWLVHDGMVLDAQRDLRIFRHLNEQWFPFTYAQLREAIDFQNSLFQDFARRHGLLFIDTARWIPQDPTLFEDGVHLNQIGTRLQAWIMLQSLVPYLQERIRNGAFPIQSQFVGEALYPHGVENRRKVSIDDQAGLCQRPS